ncbi:MAG: PD-(D/E)XK nuclease family protein, partial [Thermoplasmata archaeon]|nr:PD-(D/E)XK nuclease family protein [Thermoplasmata archaeon]
MPGPYSHSRLSTYENCPLMYKFRYIDKIETEGEGIEAFMGTRVHEALEKLYRDLKLSKTNSLEYLLAYYNERWEKSWHDDIEIVREDYTPENYKDTGKRCLTNYYKSHHPFDRDTTVALEERLRIPLDDEEERVLVGYVDRISKTGDDMYEIHDYKSSHSLPPQEKLDRDRQLALYQIGVQHKWPAAKDVKLIWHYVAMDVDMESTRSEEDLQKMKDDVKALIDEIESAEQFPAKESALCGWCLYPEMCPVKKHPSKVESLPVNEYLKDDGVKLVNKYMDAVVKRKELQ